MWQLPAFAGVTPSFAQWTGPGCLSGQFELGSEPGSPGWQKAMESPTYSKPLQKTVPLLYAVFHCSSYAMSPDHCPAQDPQHLEGFGGNVQCLLN